VRPLSRRSTAAVGFERGADLRGINEQPVEAVRVRSYFHD
jgi:hypothetical protein